MRVRMVVCPHLVLKILQFFLHFLDLIFERFDPLVIIGMVVSALVGHGPSLASEKIVIQAPSEGKRFW